MKIHVYILLYLVKSFSNNHRAQTFKLEYSFNHKIITNTRKHLTMLNIFEKNKSVRKDHIKLKHKRKWICDIGCGRSRITFHCNLLAYDPTTYVGLEYFRFSSHYILC